MAAATPSEPQEKEIIAGARASLEHWFNTRPCRDHLLQYFDLERARPAELMQEHRMKLDIAPEHKAGCVAFPLKHMCKASGPGDYQKCQSHVPPRLMYHGSKLSRLDMIISAGRLIRGDNCKTIKKGGPQGEDVWGYGVYLTDTFTAALRYAPCPEDCSQFRIVFGVSAMATKSLHTERSRYYVAREHWIEAKYLILVPAEVPGGWCQRLEKHMRHG